MGRTHTTPDVVLQTGSDTFPDHNIVLINTRIADITVFYCKPLTFVEIIDISDLIDGNTTVLFHDIHLRTGLFRDTNGPIADPNAVPIAHEFVSKHRIKFLNSNELMKGRSVTSGFYLNQ